MNRLLYKDYTITAGAIQDERSGHYAPTVHIAWRSAGTQEDSYSFTLRQRYATFDDAVAIAREEAQAWADHWLACGGL